MAKLVIKGHSIRGKELIEHFEMLSSVNTYLLDGTCEYAFYFIDDDGAIFSEEEERLPSNIKVFTFEEFLERFPYKVGDKVTHPDYESPLEVVGMKWENDSIKYEVYTNDYGYWFGVDELQPYQLSELDSKIFADGYEQGYDDGQHDMTEWNLPDGFIFKDENGNVINANKIVLEKKKPKYPKTYEESCKILDLSWNEYFGFIKANDCFTDEEKKLIESFIKLKRCRDAYWKLYGAWERHCVVYVIRNAEGKAVRTSITNPVYNHILAFPTAEMRDAFYENFKDLIEICKELL